MVDTASSCGPPVASGRSPSGPFTNVPTSTSSVCGCTPPPKKDGRDAGELANGEPIGLAVTTDADALIALKPDCVIYAASGPERDALAIPPDYVKLLSAGINVVTTSTTRLVNPHAYEPVDWRDQIAAAAKQGQVTLYASGIEPGFAADYLPLVLSTQSSQIEKIHSYEIGLYDDYGGVPDIMSDALGFGRPLEYTPWISFPRRDRRRMARPDAHGGRSARC